MPAPVAHPNISRNKAQCKWLVRGLRQTLCHLWGVVKGVGEMGVAELLELPAVRNHPHAVTQGAMPKRTEMDVLLSVGFLFVMHSD